VNEDFPCILKTREIKKDGSKYFGPFANVKAVNETVELINNIYSLKRCSKLIFKADYKGCLNMHINACKGYCILDKSEYKKTKNEYQKNIKEIIEFLKGKNKELITKISEEIKIASDNLNFERALKLRNYIYSLKEINERQRKLKYFLQKELFALQEKELLEKIITKELNKILKLKRKKYRIESYDISNFAGSFPVASLVVYFGLDKIKNDYRKFQIKSENGNDDYGHLKEVLQRRFENYKSGNKAFNILPDLLFIDGGKGQVNIALEVLEEFNLKLPVFGMVKDNKHRTRGLVKGSDLSEIDLKAHPNLYHYVANIQEETHRFAISFNIKKRSSSIKSKLDDIKGIGEKRRNILLRKFKNLENIKNAKIEEIRTLPTFNEELAKNVKKGL
jgi:excinuclease ABC subunit C